MADPVWLSTREAADELGVTRHRVWQWHTRGMQDANGKPVRLQVRWIGGRMSIRRDWLDEFLAARNGEPVDLGNPAQEDRDALRDQEEARRELARR